MIDKNNLEGLDPEAERQRLIEETEEIKKEHEAEQSEILNAVKQDEELEHDSYEWVEIGAAEFKVKAWMPGEVVDVLEGFSKAENESDVPGLRTLVDAAKTQTEVIRTEDTVWQTQAKIDSFWNEYYKQHGDTVLETATSRILTPAIENMEGRVPEKFRQKRRR